MEDKRRKYIIMCGTCYLDKIKKKKPKFVPDPEKASLYNNKGADQVIILLKAQGLDAVKIDVKRGK